MALMQGIPGRLLRGEIINRWEQLSVNEVEACCADHSKLIDVLQARYGFARRRAEREVELFVQEFQERLRMAA